MDCITLKKQFGSFNEGEVLRVLLPGDDWDGSSDCVTADRAEYLVHSRRAVIGIIETKKDELEEDPEIEILETNPKPVIKKKK